MNPRFAFVGGTNRGKILLEHFAEKGHLPEFAFIQTEDEHERVRSSNEISELLQGRGIPSYPRKKLSREDYEIFDRNELDFVIVYGWRSLLDISIEKNIKHGFVASHHSLLPKYRGFAPLQWAIINSEPITGVTLFRLDNRGADTGRIISQRKTDIGKDDYAADVDAKLMQLSLEAFDEFFVLVQTSSVEYWLQDESKATYCCKRTPDDGDIDWKKSASEIYNLIRALAHPFTGARCIFNGEKYLIRRASLSGEDKKFSGRVAGRVVSYGDSGAEVLCGDGTILLSEWENATTGEVSNPGDDIKSLSTTLK